MKKEQNLKPRKIDPILLKMQNEEANRKDWTFFSILTLAILYFTVRLLLQS